MLEFKLYLIKGFTMSKMLYALLLALFFTISPLSADEKTQKIQVALLLDTSNSMDGLIDQAKTRLWDIVNTLSTLKYQGKTPQIEISLFEYGNNSLSVESNYIRQVTPMTSDLDLISEMLFGLRTNGGSEYCGAVIQSAATKIDWSTDKNDIHLIYIAGNEEFTQGKIPYQEAIATALSKDIFVNTIYCDNNSRNGKPSDDPISRTWKDGAKLGQGKYFSINSDRKVRQIATPFDDQISAKNSLLNKTYMGYGHEGSSKLEAQSVQDSNAFSISKEVAVSRSVSKANSKVYDNASWDLVDRYTKDKEIVKKLEKKDLPAELQTKSKEEIQSIIEAKKTERETLQKEINALAKQRQAYIDDEAKKTQKDGSGDDLGKAINESIIGFAKAKNYNVEK